MLFPHFGSSVYRNVVLTFVVLLCPPGWSVVLSQNAADDVCLATPCLNGGSCENVGAAGGHVCHCRLGFTGLRCETDIDECASSPCRNGGVCRDQVAGFNCSCAAEWTGRFCETNRDMCLSQPCLNNATCLNQRDGFTCNCVAGFSGILCETNINDCLPNPCSNNGLCQDLIQDYECTCPPQYMGKNCTLPFDVCASEPCQNGGACHSVSPSRNFTCNCLPGFNGRTCETNIDDCHGVVCQSSQVCVDLVNSYECRCPQGFTGHNCGEAVNACLPDPCHNNGTCISGVGNFTCKCPPGYTGALCEHDIDECAAKPCLHGICHNTPGSYQCYCRPGFSGDHCTIDFDECLSRPCHNNGSCENLVNGYRCHCIPGFTGPECDVNIDECASDPCANGGTCEDQINAFVCHCPPGFTGIGCEVDINECDSSPCQNFGQCIDRVNRFECNCSDTGFRGDVCEINIDDCEPFLCEHNSSCTDLIKDFRCECYSGFKGHLCETDIDECADHPCENEGLCLERSNQSLYSVNYLGLFHEPFNYANASGFVCHCVPGFRGENCSENIDDCTPFLCEQGTCVDGINNYTCVCNPGYEGRNCELEIDECERFSPCQMASTCVNVPGDYKCECAREFGGKNCSVKLLGCDNHRCTNNATCEPYLIGEDKHEYRCLCRNGFYGPRCEDVTTLSLNGASYMQVAPSAPTDSYAMSLRFRTTLQNGVLVSSHDRQLFRLLLNDGYLWLQVERQGKSQQMQLEENQLNDASWQQVSIQMSSEGVTVTLASDERALHRQFHFNLTDGNPVNLGNMLIGRSVDSEPGFVGCMEDVIINDQWLIPNAAGLFSSGIEVGCQRRDQCLPDTCSRHGACIDNWNDFQCECRRPFLGRVCNTSIVPGTFGYEGETSRLEVPLSREDQSASVANVSLFLRTREKAGLVFYLGNRNPVEDNSYLGLELDNARPRVVIKSDGIARAFLASKSPALDDGFYHFLEVIFNIHVGHLRVTLNHTVVLNVSLGEAVSLTVTNFYAGSIPSQSRFRRQQSQPDIVQMFSSLPSFSIDSIPPNDQHDNSEIQFAEHSDVSQTEPDWRHLLETSTATELPLPMDQGLRALRYKGILQDIRVYGKVVPVKSSSTPHLRSLGNVTLSNVREGVVSDDSCRRNPCVNSGTCRITWNDYECLCPVGFRSKNCSLIDYCHRNSCPGNATCNSLDDGYECVTEATFNGRSSQGRFRSALPAGFLLNSLSFEYRSQQPGPILFLDAMGGTSAVLTVSLAVDGLHVDYVSSTNGGHDVNMPSSPLVFGSNVTDGNWHRVLVAFDERSVTVEFDGSQPTIVEEIFPVEQIRTQFGTNVSVYVGHLPLENPDATWFRGCLKEIRLGGVLVPFYTREKLENDTSAKHFIAEALKDLDTSSCTLCYNSECQHGGTCLSPLESYGCECDAGFEGQHCENDKDECLVVNCTHGICENLPGNFTCICNAGFTGALCEDDIDECQTTDTCLNGGTCTNTFGSYICHCNSNYTGDNCEELVTITCDNLPCQHRGTCVDRETEERRKYVCRCTGGYEGVDCETEIDFCLPQPCVHGTCNSSAENARYVCNCEPGYEGVNCEMDHDECYPNNCQHGGVCIDEINGFHCKCNTGFVGDLCEEDIDECDEDPCHNNGNCTNTIGSYNCTCPFEFFGHSCSLPNPCVTEGTCANGGLCIPDEASNASSIMFLCDCPHPYSGLYCDEKLVRAIDPENLAIVIGPVVGGMLLIVAIAAIVFLMMARKKRATRGTYSPSRQEMFGSRVEMGPVMKPPPEERLI